MAVAEAGNLLITRPRADERLGLEIAAIHAETRQRYGSARIHAELGSAAAAGRVASAWRGSCAFAGWPHGAAAGLKPIQLHPGTRRV